MDGETVIMVVAMVLGTEMADASVGDLVVDAMDEIEVTITTVVVTVVATMAVTMEAATMVAAIGSAEVEAEEEEEVEEEEVVEEEVEEPEVVMVVMVAVGETLQTLMSKTLMPTASAQ